MSFVTRTFPNPTLHIQHPNALDSESSHYLVECGFCYLVWLLFLVYLTPSWKSANLIYLKHKKNIQMVTRPRRSPASVQQKQFTYSDLTGSPARVQQKRIYNGNPIGSPASVRHIKKQIVTRQGHQRVFDKKNPPPLPANAYDPITGESCCGTANKSSVVGGPRWPQVSGSVVDSALGWAQVRLGESELDWLGAPPTDRPSPAMSGGSLG
jgi:hypothetical protein